MNRYRRPAGSTSTCGESHSGLPTALGECHTQRQELDTGLTLIRSRYCPRYALSEDSRSPHGDRPVLVITLGLAGESSYEGDGQPLIFSEGQTAITAFHSSQGQRRYRAGVQVDQLRLVVAECVLDRYLGEDRSRTLLGNGHLRRLAAYRTPAASHNHARALTRYLRQGSTAQLDLHLHALGMLREALSTLQALPISPRETHGDILERVLALMHQRLAEPLTLADLSAWAGLSERTLKVAWQRHFRTTPQRSLHTLRMHHAHTLLEQGCQVAQAAWQVGYRHPNNFSVAFTRFFGHSPKHVSGKRSS